MRLTRLTSSWWSSFWTGSQLRKHLPSSPPLPLQRSIKAANQSSRQVREKERERGREERVKSCNCLTAIWGIWQAHRDEKLYSVYATISHKAANQAGGGHAPVSCRLLLLPLSLPPLLLLLPHFIGFSSQSPPAVKLKRLADKQLTHSQTHSYTSHVMSWSERTPMCPIRAHFIGHSRRHHAVPHLASKSVNDCPFVVATVCQTLLRSAPLWTAPSFHCDCCALRWHATGWARSRIVTHSRPEVFGIWVIKAGGIGRVAINSHTSYAVDVFGRAHVLVICLMNATEFAFATLIDWRADWWIDWWIDCCVDRWCIRLRCFLSALTSKMCGWRRN